MLKYLFDWLTRADPPAPADAIFVLAGHRSRKTYAIQLLDRGMAPRLLISVGRFEIRRFPDLGLPQTIDLLQLAQTIPPPQRHFFVLFENRELKVQRITVRTLGTLSEIDALSDWLGARPGISSLLVVSSGSHLRRLRICCRALLPQGLRTSFLATPEENTSPNRQDWWSDASTCRICLFECIKVTSYFILLPWWKLTRSWRKRAI